MIILLTTVVCMCGTDRCTDRFLEARVDKRGRDVK
jgi:hypothetical protein